MRRKIYEFYEKHELSEVKKSPELQAEIKALRQICIELNNHQCEVCRLAVKPAKLHVLAR